MPKVKRGDVNRQAVLEFVIAYKRDNDGLSPTMREIADGCELSSVSLVSHHIQALIKRGHLGRTAGHHRHLTVPGGRWIAGD